MQHKMRKKVKIKNIAGAISSLMVVTSTYALAADDDALAADDIDLETITVTGTWTEQPIRDVVGSIAVVAEQEIEGRLVNNIQDLIRYEPGVSVEGNGRFGVSGFNIRGLGDDRVLILVDGIPIADQFSFGPNLSSGRDIVDVDSVKSVEILKGPASSMYGSDALAGVVQFITKTPYDYLESTSGFDSYLLAKSSYQSADHSATFRLDGAIGNDDLASFLSITRKKGSELETHGDNAAFGNTRTTADTQNKESTNVLAKVEFNLGETQKLVLTGDFFESEVESELESTTNTFSRGTLIQDTDGIDEQSRYRLSADYSLLLDTPWIKRLNAKAYWQQSETDQTTHQTRFGTTFVTGPEPIVANRVRFSEYDQEILGLNLVASTDLKTANTSHLLHYGVSYSKTDTESLRTGSTVAANTGQIIPEFSLFPTRDFPISETTKVALFLADEISFGDTGWRVIPGIRFDDFKHEPEADALFLDASGGTIPTSYDDNNVALKLGISKEFLQNNQFYLQYAEGFRIPAYDDVNVGFTNFAGGYTSLSNADLEPEESDTIELGVKGIVGDVHYEVALYHSDYKNFIESLAVRGFNPVTQLLEFQAMNVDDVEIQGLEAKLSADVTESIAINLGLSVSDSEDKATGFELNSVAPDKATIGVEWNPLDSVSFNGVITLTGSKNWDDGESISVNSHEILDLYLNLQITEQLHINGGLFNVFNREYWQYSNLLGRNDESNIARYSEPGRNLSVNVRYEF